jgi:hypothetical protein
MDFFYRMFDILKKIKLLLADLEVYVTRYNTPPHNQGEIIFIRLLVVSFH